MLARGIKTLAIRVKAQNANAQTLAELLKVHPAVAEVNYPGLVSHPDHAHAKQIFSGFGDAEHSLARWDRSHRAIPRGARATCVAPSLGGVESLVTRPATTSHSAMRPEDRQSSASSTIWSASAAASRTRRSH